MRAAKEMNGSGSGISYFSITSFALEGSVGLVADGGAGFAMVLTVCRGLRAVRLRKRYAVGISDQNEGICRVCTNEPAEL